MKVSSSRDGGLIQPVRVMVPSVAVATSKTDCATRMIFRLSTMSASAPPISPKSSVGAVLAVCTRATISGDGVIVAISHAATVACMV